MKSDWYTSEMPSDASLPAKSPIAPAKNPAARVTKRHFLGARSCSRTGVPHVRVLDLNDCGLKRTRLPHLASRQMVRPSPSSGKQILSHLERAVFRARVDVPLILRNADGLHRRLVRLECLTRSANISAPKRRCGGQFGRRLTSTIRIIRRSNIPISPFSPPV